MIIGEVYRDKDKQMQGRHVRVVATNGGRLANQAVCVPCNSEGQRLYSNGARTATISEWTLMRRFELVIGSAGNIKIL